MLKYTILLFLLLCIFNSCQKDDVQDAALCHQEVEISADKYLTAPADPLTINSIKITGDCLQINFSAGGCSGDTWQIKLIDSDAVMESYPVQRNIRLSLKNEELCDAWITREISFDIYALRVYDGPVWLNITNSDQRILYEY